MAEELTAEAIKAMLDEALKPINEKLEKQDSAIKELQEKLGKKSVSLSFLAEGIMGYVEEAGITEAHNLFNHLNNLLSSVPAWTDNVPQLKKFFRDFNKKQGGRTIM